MYQRSLVLGLGRSGESAARLLASEGTEVVVLDQAISPAIQKRAECLRAEGIEVFLEAPEKCLDIPVDICVISPGISLSSHWIQSICNRGIPLIGELELAWDRCKTKVIAVTGSNGKSTAVKWIQENLQRAGYQALIAGNYGIPFSSIIQAQAIADWIVLEISSFQLETLRKARPDIGILLNVQPNHLDRHGTMNAYLHIKSKLFAHTMDKDICIVPFSLIRQVRALSHGKGRWFSFGSDPDADFRYHDGKIYRDVQQMADLTGTMFANDVLGPSAAGIIAGVQHITHSVHYIVEIARTFNPLPHRMEKVATSGGVLFINDSKATSLVSMSAGLKIASSCKNIRLIAGGRAKENNFDWVKDDLTNKTKKVYCMGYSADKMHSAWKNIVPCERFENLNHAMNKAWTDAREGDIILFSPGCVSYDQYMNFEERGKHFKEIVKTIIEKGVCYESTI
jgi:UDP-N-acetylmuramoylalanine--D-glutamate ligase